MKHYSAQLTPLYFRHTIRLIRPFPNFDFSFIKPVRQRAANLLNPELGDRVLDVGCGPGGCFPFLRRAVGPTGQVVGVEISPEVCINARRRIEINNWDNVHVIQSAAQDVRLTGTFDGLLMFAAADVFAAEKALDNIFPNLSEGARVVLFVAKLSTNLPGKILNPLLHVLVSRLGFPTTPRPEHEPWQLLARRVEKLNIEEYFFGLMFLASASAARRQSTTAAPNTQNNDVSNIGE